MIYYPKANDFQNSTYLGTWNQSEIPVYDVPTMHALNQLIGYVKHINAGNGTVLYRGQCKLYEYVVPSILHNLKNKTTDENRLNKSIDAIIKDSSCAKFFGLNNAEIEGWSLYKKLVIEAALQHYGSKTYCVDFVDNHWTALWFGLYEWNRKNNKYIIRHKKKDCIDDEYIVRDVNVKKKAYPKKPRIEDVILDKKAQKYVENTACETITKEQLTRRLITSNHNRNIKKWEKECAKIDEFNKKIDALENQQHLFLFLYVSETNYPNVRGVYLGENTYTIDLRKALPSTFLRPCSQHGWVVRGKSNDYMFNDNIACVIRLSVDLATHMLGNGSLLSQENFFPSESIDQGYKILLSRQKNSRITLDKPKILPPDMIADFG